jgi:hypothetical protein
MVIEASMSQSLDEGGGMELWDLRRVDLEICRLRGVRCELFGEIHACGFRGNGLTLNGKRNRIDWRSEERLLATVVLMSVVQVIVLT